MSQEPCGILRLSNELLKEILDHLAQDLERCISVDHRAYLSIDSVIRPTPPDPPILFLDGEGGYLEDFRSDIDRFREVCRRFADVGTAHKFSRVVVRFSEPAFQKLTLLSARPHLARHVRSFTYIIRAFYDEGVYDFPSNVHMAAVALTPLPERAHLQPLLSAAHPNKVNVSDHLSRLEEQKKLVRSGDDLSSLRGAMTAFTHLRHVKVLRVQDEAERELQRVIERHDNPIEPLVVLDWKLACAHALRTVGTALLESGACVDRFSGPQMNAQAAHGLKKVPRTLMSELAGKLTCLEVHFDATRHVNAEMRELCDAFRTLFTSARNMEAVHLGFPSRLPLDIRLEDVFHNVHWERLRAFGIQAWRLDAEEIINFARRHSKTLKGLRLRDVLLKEGSMWKDVLSFLRDEMDNLDWVSLRRIDYSNAFDEKWAASADISDIQSFPNSDSDSDDHLDALNGEQGDDDDDSSIGSESDGLSSHNGDHGPRANQIELLPDTTIPTLPVSSPLRYRWESLAATTADELDDDGTNVEYRQRKIWEEWVVSRPKSRWLR